MKIELNRDDIGMASMLRDSMKAAAIDGKPWANNKIFLEDRIFIEQTEKFSVISVEPGGGKNYVPERYAPNWARRVDKEMANSAFALIDLLNEHNGETGTDNFAESLKMIATAMDLNGSA